MRLTLFVLLMLTFATTAHAHPTIDLCKFDPQACKRKSGAFGLPVFLDGLGLPQPPRDDPSPPRPDAANAPQPSPSTPSEPTSSTSTPEVSTKKRRTLKQPRPARETTSQTPPAPVLAPADVQPAAPTAPADTPEKHPSPVVTSPSAPPAAGALAEPPPPEPALPERSTWATAKLYLWLGFTHILPLGLDHILFVLALFLASARLRPLLVQITAFTVAHTLTLALAITGLVQAPPHIVEPLIALSIVFVAIENIYFADMTRWRPLIVFAFGLFHGLGFASVLTELGLPSDQFLTAMISFNVGVEAGQLTVVALAFVPAFLLFRLLEREGVERLYRPIAVVPVSLVIAAIGLFWTYQRTLGAG